MPERNIKVKNGKWMQGIGKYKRITFVWLFGYMAMARDRQKWISTGKMLKFVFVFLKTCKKKKWR